MKEKTLTCPQCGTAGGAGIVEPELVDRFYARCTDVWTAVRTFNVVDDFNREALAIEIDFKLPAQRVIRVLDRIAYSRGYPLKLRMDNGHEFISLVLAEWAETREVVLEFIKPGKPTQNAFIERFNRT